MGDRIIYASFNLKGFDDPESKFYNYPAANLPVLNGVVSNISLNLVDDLNLDRLVVSTNGIDGIGFNDSTFNFYGTYFKDQKIYFTVKGKSENNFPIKNLPKFRLNEEVLFNGSTYKLGLSVLKKNGSLLNTTFYALSDDYDSGGYYRGYFSVNEKINNLILKSQVVQDDSLTFNGNSTRFNIADTGEYNFRKINEDNNQTQNYKNLIYQNILNDKKVFFDDFLGTIVGNLSSNPNSLGIKTYEKISNFVSNNNDVNYSNIDNLVSLLASLDVDFQNINIKLPASTKRLVDNLSVNLSLLRGQNNEFNLNFDNKGTVNSKFLGINKGPRLDFYDTNIYLNDPKYILAREKFSDKYTLLNTNLISATDIRFYDRIFESELRTEVSYNPSESFALITESGSAILVENAFFTIQTKVPSVATGYFQLSDYKTNWGWGLILPPDLGKSNFFKYEGNTVNEIGQDLSNEFICFQGNYYRLRDQNFDPVEGDQSSIEKYYTFYEYLSTPLNQPLQEFIDYKNPNTTIGPLTSFGKYNQDGGIVHNVIIKNFLTNTSLLTSNE